MIVARLLQDQPLIRVFIGLALMVMTMATAGMRMRVANLLANMTRAFLHGMRPGTQ